MKDYSNITLADFDKELKKAKISKCGICDVVSLCKIRQETRRNCIDCAEKGACMNYSKRLDIEKISNLPTLLQDHIIMRGW